MAGPGRRRYRRAVPSDAVIASVLGAAGAAAGSHAAAEDATVEAFARGGDAERVAATAIRLALQAAPAPAFAPMCPQDAEAVALARLLRLPEGRIAALLGVPRSEVRRRLRRGLTTTLPALAGA
jgi:DNA-directed RNA polymerase specialized sigma24 family protein